jgi:hypothetical protein
MNNKIGVTYKPTDNYISQPLPTKYGTVMFEFKPVQLDQSWVAVNNMAVKREV